MEVTKYESVIEYIISQVKSHIDISEYEGTMINQALSHSREPLPSSKSSSANMVDTLINDKSNLSYIVTRLKERRLEANKSYRKDHELKYVQLTRMGRPSREAIISEIHSLDASMQVRRDELESLDQVIEVIGIQISIIDSKIRNIERRSYDL